MYRILFYFLIVALILIIGLCMLSVGLDIVKQYTQKTDKIWVEYHKIMR